MGKVSSFNQLLSELSGERISMPAVLRVARLAMESRENTVALIALAKADTGRGGINALWCLTHVQKADPAYLQEWHDDFIDMLLAENHTGRKRMLLQVLRGQAYDPDTLRTDFLDFCLSKINAECEPYAIRAFSLYCAYNMCKFYPELIAELNEHLHMLDLQAISAGLRSALRTTRLRISKLRVCKK